MIGNIPIIPIATPLPMTSLATVNSYLINVEPVTLIDTGLKYIHSEAKLDSILTNHGIDIDSIERIIITHGHPDHFGMGKVLQKKTGAEVFINIDEIKKITEEYILINTDARFLKTTGLPFELINLGNQINTVMKTFCEPLEDVTPISNNYKFDFKRFSLQSLHMPGHSIGHTCFFLPEVDILFSGDIIIPDITAIPVLEQSPQFENQRTPSLLQILDSLTKLSNMDIDLVLPGHGDAINKPRPMIHKLISFYRERLRKVYSLLKATTSITPYELSRKLFCDANGFDLILALCETMVNLDYLVFQGKVEETTINGVSHFYRSDR